MAFITNARKIGHQSAKTMPKEISTKTLIFRCSCGKKILIVPDLVAMNRAIKNHLQEHKELTGHNITEERLTQELLKILSRAI